MKKEVIEGKYFQECLFDDEWKTWKHIHRFLDQFTNKKIRITVEEIQ